MTDISLAGVWAWVRSHRLVVLLGAALLATHFQLVTWGRVEEMINRLAAQPGVAATLRAGDDEARVEAFFILFAFLFFTPAAVVAGSGMVLLAFAILAGLLAPVGRFFRIPGIVLDTLLAVALSVLAYARQDLWAPWLLWMLGLVARAYLVVT